MSQLLLVATVIVLALAAIVSLDIMGFAFWKGNQFEVERRVSRFDSYRAEHH